MTRLLIVPVLLVLGGLVAWSQGRHLIPEQRSPTFPERWWAHRARLVGLGGLLVTVMVLGISPHMWSLGLALTAATLVLAHYPVRRAAYGETWGLLDYVGAAVSRGAAFFGFWILLALTPQLIVGFPDHRWVVASALAALLLAGLRYRREIVLQLVRATRLEFEPDGFAGVLARANIATPVTVYRAGVMGGLWAHSFALPSPGRHAVVIGDSLVATLDPDALAALLAHEVARLERWTDRRLSLVSALATGLVLVAAFGSVGLVQLGAERAMQGAAMWGGALMLALAMWMLARRGDGRSGDLRAVALCEDAPALVRALSVVHAVRRIPRRLSAFDEETSAHPSLARRLQAIREAAGLAPAALVSPVVLSAPDLARVVVLDAERVQWLEGVSAGVAREADAVRVSADSVRSLAYRQLTDLRLVTGRRGATWLRATHRSGRSWSAPIRTQDLAAAQTALDVIDERLSAEHSVTRRRGALLIAFAAAAAVSAWAQVGPSPIIVLAALVAARPRQSPSWVVALLIGVWAVQHGIAARAAMPSLVAPLTAALMAVGAMAFVVGPAVRRRAVLRPTPGQTAAVTGALAGFAVVLGADVLWVARLAAAPIPSWRVDAVALALLAATIVVALGQWRRRWVSAAAGAALGLAVFQWGPAAVAAWAPLASGTPLAAHEVSTPSSRVVPLDASARRLVVSPSASQFAVQIGRSRTNMPYDTVLARFDGPPRHLSAYDLAFVDDTVALLIGRGITGLELKALPLDSAAVPDPLAWSIALPAVYEPRLSVDAPSGVWTIVGWHPDEADAISVTGRIGDDARQVKRWAIPGEDAHASFSYLPALDTAFSVTRTSLTHWPALLSRLAGVPEHRWELWKLDGKTGATVAVTAADLTCLDPLARDEVLLCLARHPTHTVIWSVDGRTGRITEVGATGPVRLARLRPGHVRLVMMDGEILRIPRGGRQALRFTPAPEPGHVIEMDSTTDHVALLMRTRAETRLALHPAR